MGLFYKRPGYNTIENFFEKKEQERKNTREKAYVEYARKLFFLKSKFLNDFTFEDAIWHYRLGKGAPIDVNLSSLDLSGVRKDDFKNTRYRHQNHPMIYVNFDQGYYTNPKQALIYGTIALVLIGPNRVMALPDTYDFDIKLNPTVQGIIRDIATLWGAFYSNYGTAYEIRFNGTSSILF